jgi:hypothetical protein
MAPKECAYERMIEIIRETEPDRAEALIRLFEDDELFNTWGNTAGRTCDRRLKWVLNATGSVAFLPLHFIDEFEGDCGFFEGLQDDHFYRQVWDPDAPPSNQVGHFLTAVDMTYNRWAIGFMLGHEQYHDLDFFRNNFSYLWVSTEDIDRWYAAAEYDEQGLPGKRDEELWAILHFKPTTPFESVEPNRQGNSLQDLRLSMKGFRFAQWIRENKSAHPDMAGSWLRLQLKLPSLPSVYLPLVRKH